MKNAKSIDSDDVDINAEVDVATCGTFKCGIRGKIGFIDRGIMRLLAASRLMDGSEILRLAPFERPWAALKHISTLVHIHIYI